MAQIPAARTGARIGEMEHPLVQKLRECLRAEDAGTGSVDDTDLVIREIDALLDERVGDGRVVEVFVCPRSDCDRHKMSPFKCRGVGSDRHPEVDAEPSFMAPIRRKGA